MNKLVTGLCAFCCLVVVSSEQLSAQLAREPQLPANTENPLIRVDDNYTGYFNDLVGKDVEVIGNILFAGEVGKDKELQEWVSTSRGAFILTNWGRLWKNKKVRVIGHVTKGIDEYAEFVKKMKPGEHMPAMAFRIEYLLTIKSIELLEDKAPEPRAVPQASQLVPQAPQMVPQR